MTISPAAAEIIEDARLFRDQERTWILIDKHGIGAAVEAIVVLSRVLPQGVNIPHVAKR
jgi:hypothetical protein